MTLKRKTPLKSGKPLRRSAAKTAGKSRAPSARAKSAKRPDTTSAARGKRSASATWGPLPPTFASPAPLSEKATPGTSEARLRSPVSDAAASPCPTGPFSGVNRLEGPHSLDEAAAMPSTQRVNHGWPKRLPFNEESVEKVKRGLRDAGVDPAAFSMQRVGTLTGELADLQRALPLVEGRELSVVDEEPMRSRIYGAPRKGPWRSRAYLDYVRSLPCAWCKAMPPSEASHHGKHGVGSKSPDWNAIPLCAKCHRQEFHGKGRLGAMDRQQTDFWVTAVALKTLGAWVSR